MIYFDKNLTNIACKIACEYKDLVDECNDLARINRARNNLSTNEGLREARILDDEFKRKYPMIDLIIDVIQNVEEYIDRVEEDI